MDRGDASQDWLPGQRVSSSPSDYSLPLPTFADYGNSEAGPSNWQERGYQPNQWDLSEWQALPDNQYGQQAGTSSSATVREKRRRRSSSFDEGVSYQGMGGEMRGREQHRPPARRQRVAIESEDDWRTGAEGSMPANVPSHRRPSVSLAPHGYSLPPANYPPWGREMGTPPVQWSRNPPEPTAYRYEGDNRNHNPSQMGHAQPGYPSPPRLPLVDDHRSRGSGQWHHAQYGTSAWSSDWNARQGWGGSHRHYPVQERVGESPLNWNVPQAYGGTRQGFPIHDHSATNNIANATNVLMGNNYGNVFMESGSASDFMRTLADQLKVCFRADYMHHPSGEETALHRTQCTPGTRVNIRGGIVVWAIDTAPDCECVFWLSGQAGAGKTTVAFTISCYFQKLVANGSSGVLLGGTFFCSRHFGDTRSTSSIVRTLVYRLALHSQSFRAALRKFGRFETVDHGPRSQFMDLLVEPWTQSLQQRRANNEPIYILPIDALDELEGTGGTEFLGTLFDVVAQHSLPGLKFLVTSRLDPVLVRRIEAFPNKQVCRLEQVPLEESSADIKVYLEASLWQCASPKQIEQLVLEAAGLFIYAATVVEFLKGRENGEQATLLERLLSAPSSVHRPSHATAKLDNLYLQILESSLVDPRDLTSPGVFHECLSILHTFICTIERTSTSVAVDILNASRANEDAVLATDMANGVLHRLHGVLYTQEGQVMWFHKSFIDFLSDEKRSQRFFCNQEDHHHRLAVGCFKIMADQLQFNMAKISSSFQMDSDIPNLQDTINANIRPPLRYACGNWSGHLALTSSDALVKLVATVNTFLQLQSLFWMESMILLGQRGRCQDVLRQAHRCFSKTKNGPILLSELADVAAFAAYHSTSKAASSTPHLYLSSLSTFSRDSTLIRSWRRQFNGIPRFTSARIPGAGALVSVMTTRHAVKALGVSPDGVHIAVGSPDGSVRVFSLSTGEEVAVLKGHSKAVTAVAYSPDGAYLVSSSEDKTLRVWDLVMRVEERVLNGHTKPVAAAAYSPDGCHVASGSWDGLIGVWDLANKENTRFLKGHTKRVMAITYTQDGTFIVSGSNDESVRVWDAATGEQVRVLEGHTKWIKAVACSINGVHVISGAGDGSVRLWNRHSGEQVMVLKGHGPDLKTVAYSPDGTRIASGAGEVVRVWDSSTGKLLRVARCPQNAEVTAVAYSSDGTSLISGSSKNSIHVWDPSTQEEAKGPKGHSKRIIAVAYSPCGNRVVSGSTDKSVRVWDVSTGDEVAVLKGHSSYVNAVAYSPNGTHIASSSGDKSLRIWDLATAKMVGLLKADSEVVAVAYSPDGAHLASGSVDRTLQVWELSTGKEVKALKGHTGSVRALAYSPNGLSIISGSDDKTLRVWDLSTGESRILKGHAGPVYAVACSRDGTRVVSGSCGDSVRVWDTRTAEEVMVLRGHGNTVTAVAYLPDGNHVVSASDDHSIRLWDLSTGDTARVFKGHTSWISALAISPDGTRIASGSNDESVRIWDVSPGYKPSYIREQGPDGKYTGWLVSPTDPSAYLMFVGPEALLSEDPNVLTIPRSVASHVDFSNAKFGDRWTECYTPRPL